MGPWRWLWHSSPGCSPWSAGAGRCPRARGANPSPPGRRLVRVLCGSKAPKATDSSRPQRPDLRRRRDWHRVRSRHLGLRVPDNWTWPVSRGRRGSRLDVLGDDVRRAGRPRPGCGACRTSPCPWHRGRGRAPRSRADVDARPGLHGCHRHDDHRSGRRADLPAAHPHNSGKGRCRGHQGDHADGEPPGRSVGRWQCRGCRPA